jgi:hypothetical protein
MTTMTPARALIFGLEHAPTSPAQALPAFAVALQDDNVAF